MSWKPPPPRVPLVWESGLRRSLRLWERRFLSGLLSAALGSEAGGAGLPPASGNAGAHGAPWSGPALGTGGLDFRE